MLRGGSSPSVAHSSERTVSVRIGTLSRIQVRTQAGKHAHSYIAQKSDHDDNFTKNGLLNPGKENETTIIQRNKWL